MVKAKGYFLAFLFYAAAVFILLLPIFLTKGAIAGGDWSLPVTPSQLNASFDSLKSSWTAVGNIFGARQIAPMSIIFIGAVKLFTYIGLAPVLAIKILTLLIIAWAGANTNLFLRKLNLRPAVALIGGLLFITTPIFFNYFLMGWIFVLLAMAILPLFLYCFVLALEQGQWRYALLCSILFSLAILQSQALIWYPLTALIAVLALAHKRDGLAANLKIFGLMLAGFILLNLYWLPGLLLFPDKIVTSNDDILSSISLGTSAHLGAVNILRLWGSLFNYQFETSLPRYLELFSFTIPALALAAIAYIKQRRYLYLFLALYLVPFLFYLIDRKALLAIPFSNLIRDLARFTTISSFGAVVLASLALDRLSRMKQREARIALVLAAIGLILNAYPFWSGRLFSRNLAGSDFRLRTKEWPVEYNQLEQKFEAEDHNKRALFLPLGGMLSLDSDGRFKGPYQETWDIYANFSPISGMIGFSDKDHGVSASLMKQINNAVKKIDGPELARLTEASQIDFLVFRRDIAVAGEIKNNQKAEQMLRQLIESGQARQYYDRDSLLVLEFNHQPKIRAYTEQVLVAPTVGGVLKSIFPGPIRSLSATMVDFDQADDLTTIHSLISPQALLSFGDQNKSYAGYTDGSGRSRPAGSFISLDELNGNILKRRWMLEQQLQSSSLDKRTREYTEMLATSAIDLKQTDLERARYFTYLDSALTGRLYFKIDVGQVAPELTNGLAKIKIDDLDSKTGLGLSAPVRLEQGLNIIEAKGAEPVLFLAEESPKALSEPKTEFEIISPTKVKVRISGITDGDFFLNFADSFNSNWGIYNSGALSAKEVVSQNGHFVANGYANGWRIEPAKLKAAGLLKESGDGSGEAVFYLQFWPQNLLVIGLWLCGGILILFLTAFYWPKGKR